MKPQSPIRSTSLKINFAWTTAGNAVYAACQWGMVSALAKLGSAEIVGQYALALAIATPVLMLAQLNLRSVIATDAAHRHPFRTYRNVRLAGLSLALLGLAGFAWIEPGAGGIRLVVVALALALEWMSDVYHGLMQREDRMNRIAISLASRGLLSLASLAVVIAATGNLLWGLSAVIVARLAVLLIYDANAATRDLPDSGPRAGDSPWPVVTTALPLGVVLMIGSLWSNVPRYFIAHHLGERELGIFAALASLTTAANLIVNALGQSATPRLARMFAAGDNRGFLRLSGRLTLIGLGLGMMVTGGCWLVGGIALRILFGPEYAARVDLLVALGVAATAGFVASLLGFVITAARRFREQMPVQAAAVAASAAFCAWLVPVWGLLGAAAGIAIAGVVQALGEALILWLAVRQLPAAPAELIAVGEAAE